MDNWGLGWVTSVFKGKKEYDDDDGGGDDSDGDDNNKDQQPTDRRSYIGGSGSSSGGGYSPSMMPPAPPRDRLIIQHDTRKKNITLSHHGKLEKGRHTMAYGSEMFEKSSTGIDKVCQFMLGKDTSEEIKYAFASSGDQKVQDHRRYVHDLTRSRNLCTRNIDSYKIQEKESLNNLNAAMNDILSKELDMDGTELNWMRLNQSTRKRLLKWCAEHRDDIKSYVVGLNSIRATMKSMNVKNLQLEKLIRILTQREINIVLNASMITSIKNAISAVKSDDIKGMVKEMQDVQDELKDQLDDLTDLEGIGAEITEDEADLMDVSDLLESILLPDVVGTSKEDIEGSDLFSEIKQALLGASEPQVLTDASGRGGSGSSSAKPRGGGGGGSGGSRSSSKKQPSKYRTTKKLRESDEYEDNDGEMVGSLSFPSVPTRTLVSSSDSLNKGKSKTTIASASSQSPTTRPGYKKAPVGISIPISKTNSTNPFGSDLDTF